MSLSVLLTIALSLLAVVLALATVRLTLFSANACAPAILALAVSGAALRAAVVAQLALGLLASGATLAFMVLLSFCRVTRHVASYTPLKSGLWAVRRGRFILYFDLAA
jgi:hypothetical protein